MHELARRRRVVVLEHDVITFGADAFDRNHRVRVGRQHRAGHDLDAVAVVADGDRIRARRLHADDAEAARTVRERGRAHADTVHRYAVERRLVPLGGHAFAQDRTLRLCQRHPHCCVARHALGNQADGVGDVDAKILGAVVAHRFASGLASARNACISARIDSAIDSASSAPIASPTGPCKRPASAAASSISPTSRSRRATGPSRPT